MTTGKALALIICPFVGKVMSLLFNMLFRFVIVFLARSKHLLISCLQSLSKVILEPKKRKSVSASIFSLLFAMKFFLMLSCKPSTLSPLSRGSLGSSSLYAIRVVLSAYLRLLIFLLEILIPVCASYNLAFLMMYSEYKLNKQVTIYSFDVLLSQFWTSLLFHVQF